MPVNENMYFRMALGWLTEGIEIFGGPDSKDIVHQEKSHRRLLQGDKQSAVGISHVVKGVHGADTEI